jgi:hypothetical protein
VGVDLREQRVCVAHDGFHGVGTGYPPRGRIVGIDERHEGGRELGRVAALPAIHALPSILGPGAQIGVVVDRELGPRRRLGRQQLGAKEAGLDDRGANAEQPRRCVGHQALAPSRRRRADLDLERFDIASEASLTLFAYTAEPGSRSAQGLDLLASWAATPHATPPDRSLVEHLDE